MKKVMILEDEVSIRSFVVINLKRAGYEVVEAGTGEEALELLERVPAEEAPEDDTEPEAETPETEPDSELAAYRRAALTEQNAAARARRLQAHVSALCDNARSRYQDTGEEISALSVDLTTGIERLQDALAELQLIFDQSEEAFEALELPDEDA